MILTIQAVVEIYAFEIDWKIWVLSDFVQPIFWLFSCQTLIPYLISRSVTFLRTWKHEKRGVLCSFIWSTWVTCVIFTCINYFSGYLCGYHYRYNILIYHNYYLSKKINWNSYVFVAFSDELKSILRILCTYWGFHQFASKPNGLKIEFWAH